MFRYVRLFLQSFYFTKAQRKLYESKLSEDAPKADSPKVAWLLLKALQKQADFRWKLSQSRVAFVESSMKASQKTRKVGGPKFPQVLGPNICHPA